MKPLIISLLITCAAVQGKGQIAKGDSMKLYTIGSSSALASNSRQFYYPQDAPWVQVYRNNGKKILTLVKQDGDTLDLALPLQIHWIRIGKSIYHVDSTSILSDMLWRFVEHNKDLRGEPIYDAYP